MCNTCSIEHLACTADGNAENITADGKANVMADGTMEAVYFGSGYAPRGKGSGSGPWIGEQAAANFRRSCVTSPLLLLTLNTHTALTMTNRIHAPRFLVRTRWLVTQVLIWRTEFTRGHRTRLQFRR